MRFLIDCHPLPVIAAADWFEITAAAIIFLITGIAQFLQKRARQKQGLPDDLDPETFGGPIPEARNDAPPLLQQEPPAESRTPSTPPWEEEFRRLFEPERPPTPTPPPPLVHAPPPLPSLVPTTTSRSASSEDLSPRSRPLAKSPRPSRTVAHRRPHRPSPRPLPAVSPLTPLTGARRDIAPVVALLRRPESARQALIAAFVLQAPKGLEPSPGDTRI